MIPVDVKHAGCDRSPEDDPEFVCSSCLNEWDGANWPRSASRDHCPWCGLPLDLEAAAENVLDHAIALEPHAFEAIRAEADTRGFDSGALAKDILMALHFSQPAACFTAEERLVTLMNRLRKALMPAARAVVGEGDT